MTDEHSHPATEHFEIVGAPVRSNSGPRRRYVAGLALAAVAVGAVSAGVLAWRAWTAQGPQPAEALPGDTLAYLALDFDPPGRQKVAAFDTLRKFPSLKHQLDGDTPETVKKSVVTGIATQGACRLDYAARVKPWIGDRLAFAVVQQDGPQPVLVVQTKDADRARRGLETARHECDGAGFGYAVDGQWVVLAESTDIATEVVRDAGRRALADDGDFRRLTQSVGDPGLATLYAAPEAGPALLDATDRDPWLGWTAAALLNGAVDPVASLVGGVGLFFSTVSVGESMASGAGFPAASDGDVPPELRARQRELQKQFEHFDQLSRKEQRRLLREQERLFQQMYPDPGSFDTADSVPDAPPLPARLRSSLQHFSGLGGVVRFDGGTLELDVVSGRLAGTFADLYAGHDGDALLGDVPAGTAVAYDVGLADGWASAVVEQLKQIGPDQSSTDPAAAFEQATGLDLPGDLEDLGGDNVAFTAGAGFAPDHLSDDPARVPVAARISGDPDKVEAALDKLRARIGPKAAAHVRSRRVGHDVVVGPDAAYLEELADVGDDLAHSDRFRRVAPSAGDATTVLFVDFDAGDWLAKLAGSDRDRADVEPLDSLGLTMTEDEHQQRLRLRVTFD